MANTLDLDEMAFYEASHSDLHCLQRYLFLSTDLEEYFSEQEQINILYESAA